MIRSRALSTASVLELLRRVPSLRVWVAGDLMLDEYLEGQVRRISPEAPVQVVNVRESFHRLGGAAHVAHQIAALGASVELCGVVGEDEAGGKLIATCAEAGVGSSAIARLGGHTTVRKLRILSQHQQLLRMDWDSPQVVPSAVGLALLDRLRSGPPPDAIVVSDYAKGFLGNEVVRAFIDEGRRRGIPVLVDPKRETFAIYQGATLITPNLGELQAVLGAIGSGIVGDDPQAVVDSARPLVISTGLDALVVTLGRLGLIVVPREGEADLVPAAGREVFDVTGAGDTVIATLAVGLAAGADLASSARLANVAAGIGVGKVGTAVVTPDELAREFSPRSADKVLTREALVEQLAWWRLQKRRVVFTNGCFDLLHVGHIALLRTSASHGDVLLVGLNSDRSVSRLKGPARPLIPQHERAALLAALDCVDGVVIFDEDTPLALIDEVQPSVLVKGADYHIDEIIGRESVERHGGRVELVPVVAGHSTSRVIERIRSQGQGAAQSQSVAAAGGEVAETAQRAVAIRDPIPE